MRAETYVPDLMTPATPAELYTALRLAWPGVIQDTLVTREALLVLLAHWAFETGWGHYCHRNNLGNAKHVPGDGHDYTAFRHNEIVGGRVVWIDPPHDPFIAFDNLLEGAAYYLTSLRGQWRAAWPFVLAGDPAGFCHALKVRGYYTDDEAHYTANVIGCMRTLDAMIPRDAPVGPVAQAALAQAANDRDFRNDDPPDPPPEAA